ncbi:hypothetical protein R1sor_002845 [Riccia sorocarpa]|uniref:Uncharacterized protein n=1 Tax=Riccia sorocarpa TaxID=122646 RepID=A0ABD3H0A8_9MARC
MSSVKEYFAAKPRFLCMKLMIVCYFLAKLSDFILQVSGTTSETCFSGLFIFGDSFVDTGNAAGAFPGRSKDLSGYYAVNGEVSFSDGKLMGDFAALAVGLSPPSSYLNRDKSSQMGINFAVAGSTVLDDYPAESLSDSNFLLTRTPFNLETQIQWWIDLKSQATDGRAPSVDESLHLVLTGATDYLLQYSSNFSHHQVLASVPFIVNRIAKNLEELHVSGAQTVLVISLPPLGCTAAFLSMFPGETEDYDAYGCLKNVNTAILRHNQQLFRAVSRLQRTYKSMASFVFADFYGSTYDIVKDPQQFGFDQETLLRACCGMGEMYNFSRISTCGGIWVGDDGVSQQVLGCGYPSTRLTWDGFHVSESATRIAVTNFFKGKHVYPARSLLPNDCKADFTSFQADASSHAAP